MASFDRLFRMDWSEFYGLVRDQAYNEEWLWTYDTLKERLWVLEEAHELFDGHDKFSEMSTHFRTRIAGVSGRERKEKNEVLYGCIGGARTPENSTRHLAVNRNDIRNSLEWHWFGIMNAWPKFKPEIDCNNSGISSALDHIPLRGRVTYSDFESFVDSFCHALNLRVRRSRATGTATRLLVYKRPDFFVSFNRASSTILSQVYTRSGVSGASGVSVALFLKDYWSKVIMPILATKWWRSPEPENGLEARVWRCRAAILDVLFYEPEELHPTHSPKIEDVPGKLQRYLESKSWDGSTRIV